MKIKQLKINGFGNLQDRQLDFGDNINIIYGKNESGKSTLLKCITNMLYGTSKNKKGKEISDFEQFKPWQTKEFSGKISYTLDNGEVYEVFREFNSKNPKIYNSLGEDISKNYTIDKTKGNLFFFEQTQIEEDIFLASSVAMQQEVQLEKQEQNRIIQRIANVVGTGQDNVSFKKAMDNLNKKQLEQVGTARSQDRPINRVTEQIQQLQSQKKDLMHYQDEKYKMEQAKNKLQQQANDVKQDLEIANSMQQIKQEQQIQQERLKVNMEQEQKYEDKLQQLLQQQKEYEAKISQIKNDKSQKKIGIHWYVSIFILLIVITIILYYMKLKMLMYCVAIVIPIIIVLWGIQIIKANNNKQKSEKEKQQLSFEKQSIIREIEQMQCDKEHLQEEIKKWSYQIDEQLDKKIYELKIRYQHKKQTIHSFLECCDIQKQIEEIQQQYNANQLELGKIQLEEQNITQKLERLATIQEELTQKQEEYQQLDNKSKSISIAKEVLEQAYIMMKEKVTPQFTQNLSDTISKISKGKYTKVKLNDENGLVIERITGEYISAERLSVGTIDQLYLALRLAILKQIAKENIPIILDESFAYYDEDRLKNILAYIKEEMTNQVFILTCTNREKQILDKQQIPYQYIEM